MAKKRMPVYGIIGVFRDFLAHNLVKCQYFSVIPSLFDKCSQITYSLQVTAQYLLIGPFYIEKPQKNFFCIVLSSRFQQHACHKKSISSHIFQYFWLKFSEFVRNRLPLLIFFSIFFGPSHAHFSAKERPLLILR